MIKTAITESSSIETLLMIEAVNEIFCRLENIRIQRHGKAFILNFPDTYSLHNNAQVVDSLVAVRRIFPHTGTAWLSYVQEIHDPHLEIQVLMSAANAAEASVVNLHECNALDLLKSYVASDPSRETFIRMLYVNPCTHETADITQPLRRLRSALKSPGEGYAYLAMTDIHGYGEGLTLCSDGTEKKYVGQLELLKLQVEDLSLSDDRALFSTLRRASQIRHAEQSRLRNYLRELHLLIRDLGGSPFDTNGDGVVALMPDRESITLLSKACDERSKPFVSGVGAVPLELLGTTQSEVELLRRLDFATGITKVTVRVARHGEAQVYGELDGTTSASEVIGSFSVVPHKTQEWVRNWSAKRPGDWERIFPGDISRSVSNFLSTASGTAEGL